jgi:DNA-binding response OmpR family regulator
VFRGRQMRKPRILVVEDHYLLAEVVCDFVRDCNMIPVGPALDLKGGLELARYVQVEGAILDINLFGEFCFPICLVLSQRNIPFLFLTAYDPFVIPAEFRAAPLIHKPFLPDKFAPILQELVGEQSNGHSHHAPAWMETR